MTHTTHHIASYGSTSCGTRGLIAVTLPTIPGVQIDGDRAASAPNGRTIRRPTAKRRAKPVDMIRRACLELMQEARA